MFIVTSFPFQCRHAQGGSPRAVHVQSPPIFLVDGRVTNNQAFPLKVISVNVGTAMASIGKSRMEPGYECTAQKADVAIQRRPNDQAHRAGASPLDESCASAAPPPLQPLIRRPGEKQLARDVRFFQTENDG
jgi:hypothetical protein